MAQVDITQITGFSTTNGNTIFTGNLIVSGAATIIQTGDHQKGLTLSGSMDVQDAVNIASGSITIKNFDTFGDKDTPNIIDLGTF
jgi:hypothetical protein